MQPLNQQGTTTFPIQDPVSRGTFNPDGTNSLYPVISAGTQTVANVTYNLQKLSISDKKYGSDSITFKKQNYTIYSVVPQANTIDYAYKNCTPSTPAPYYDPNALTNIDFTIPNTINGGNPTAVATQPPSAPTLSPYTQEMVYLTTTPSDPNSLYFIPNLPNSTGSHNGLTANIYFVSDPYIGKSGYAPSGSTYHLTPYGWASGAAFVNNPYVINWLNSTGGAATGATTVTANPPFNYWKHSIQGKNLSTPNIATQIMQGIQTDTNYPFPSGIPAKYLNWLVTYNQSTKTYTMNGLYMHVQPEPGFQRNLLRYYTAWGTADIYNQASDLFVRADGTIELPAVKNASGTWQYAPIVTQTWDGSQRFTLLNQTKSQVPSTYDDYPGYENYSLANVYLPGHAGVVTSYINYWVWDGQSTGTTPTAREMDQWLGLRGMSANDVQIWDTANGTEPGGQGGKPYMFGATTTYNSSTRQWNYAMRLQASNSFGVAKVLQSQLQGQLYDASFYVNLNDDKGYQKAATISYQWQPWTIGSNPPSLNAIWKASSDSYGAGVATLTYANVMGGQAAISANQATWNENHRELYWTIGGAINPSQWNTYNSTLGNSIWGNYIIKGTASAPNTQYLIILNPAAYFTSAGGGDWGTAGNWSSEAVPDDNYNVYLQQNGTVTYNNILATAPPLSMLQVDGFAPGATLQINPPSPTGDLKAEMALVGAGNQGTLSQSAGTVTLTDTLYLGHAVTGTGTYNLVGGSLSASNVVVGNYGTGTFTQTAGVATLSGTLTLASQSGSTGTYNLQGGTLTTVNTMVGLNNIGTFTQNGGTYTVSDTLTIGAGSTYNGTGGNLKVGKVINNGNFNPPGPGGRFTYNQLVLQGGNFVGNLDNQTLLTGYGPITGTLTNSGTVSPGHSPGTLSVVGSYVQTATGIYTAEIASADSYDKISITGAPGTASLSGTIVPTPYGGFQPRGNQVFPGVVTATGGITGAFSTILNQQINPTLFWQTRYNPTSVDLWVQRNYTNAGLSLNSNQQGVGAMLNSVAGVTSGDLDNVLNAIDYLPDRGSVQNAFKQISPEKAGALTNLGFGAANFQMRNLATRTTNLRFVQGEGGGASGFTGGGLGFDYSTQQGMMLAFSGASLSNLFSARKEFQAPESRWGLYLDGGAAFGNQNSSINQTGYNYNLGGMTLGADYRLRDNLLVGLATGYSNTSAGFYGSGGSVSTNTVPFNVYAAYFPGSLYAYGSLGYALNLYDLNRGLSFNGINRSTTSSTTGNQLNLYGETGYDLKLSRFILTPSATLAYSGLWVGSFTESGAGALDLKVAAQNANSMQTGLGGRLTVPVRVGSVKVVPQGYVFYQHEFANGSRGLNASLSQGSSTCNFQTDATARNYALVGASLTVGLKRNLYAQANFNTEVGRGSSTAQSINAGLRWEF